MPRGRGWCFTINNFNDEDIEQVKALIHTTNFQYVCVGKEIGESGTPHLQGYCYWRQPKSHTAIAGYLTRASSRVARGTAQENKTYCSKEHLWYEEGTIPTGPTGQADKWKEVIRLAEEGNLAEIKDTYPAIYIRYYGRLRSLYSIERPVLQGPLGNEWWVGPPGTGKSKRLHRLYPNHFPKMLNKWWDGYMNEEVIGIEEWEPDSRLAHHLKIWADRYPFNAEIKGGCIRNIRPERIIVLSNFKIEECFPTAITQQAIRRRFKVYHFIADGCIPLSD